MRYAAREDMRAERLASDAPFASTFRKDTSTTDTAGTAQRGTRGGRAEPDAASVVHQLVDGEFSPMMPVPSATPSPVPLGW